MVDRSKQTGNVQENIERIDGRLDAAYIHHTICLPVTLAGMTENAEILTDYVPGFAGEVVSLAYVAGVAATTGSKDGKAKVVKTDGTTDTDVTGALLSLTTAKAGTIGKVEKVNATAEKAFSATTKLSIVCPAPTAIFVEGSGTIVLVLAEKIA